MKQFYKQFIKSDAPERRKLVVSITPDPTLNHIQVSITPDPTLNHIQVSSKWCTDNSVKYFGIYKQ